MPVALAVVVALYGMGLHAAAVRGIRQRLARRRDISCFVIGLAAAAVALLSPIDAASEALFSAHMVQHLLLIVVAAPLIVLGNPTRVMLWGVPTAARKPVGRLWRRAHSIWKRAARPGTAWSLQTAALWIWHAPPWYDRAMSSESIHILEHATFFGTALLFWSVALDRKRLNVASATLFLFLAALQCTLLGALLTMAHHPWYQAHATTTRLWGLSPLEDQQLAGLIMWIPAGMAYLIAIVPRWIAALSTPRYGVDAMAGVSARGTPYSARMRSMSL